MRLTEKGKVGDGHPQAALFDKFVDEYGARNRGTSSGARGAQRKKESSSLEFRPPTELPTSTFAHPPTMKGMKSAQLADTGQQMQAPLAKQRQVKTRARGASGLPPRKYTLEELPHLDQETLLKALYDDPELARAFAEEHQKDESRSGSSSSTAGTGGPKMKRSMKQPRTENKYRRAKDGTVEKQPQFLDELKKGGVPVAQWAVLLAIAAAVSYQLYKILSGPKATAPSGKKQKVPITKKGKQSKDVKTKRQLAVPVPDGDPVQEEVLAEVEKVVADPTAEKKKKTSAKRSAKKPNSVNAKQKTAATSAKAPIQEPKAPAKENGAKHIPAPAVQDIPAPAVEDIPARAVKETIEPVIVDDGEWETVSKRTVPAVTAKVAVAVVEPEPAKPKADNGAGKGMTVDKKETAKTEVPVPKPVEMETNPVVSSKEPEPEPPKEALPAKPEPVVSKEEVKVIDESAKENTPDDSFESVSRKKKNKKKVKKQQEEVTPQNGEAQNGEAQNGEAQNGEAQNGEAQNGEAQNGEEKTTETITVSTNNNKEEETLSTPLNPTVTKNDAQLALELQAQEEVLAAAESASSESPQDDVWEEVTTRRRKPVIKVQELEAKT